MWRAKAPATSFVADWSRADRTDAEATKFFLENVWPALSEAGSWYLWNVRLRNVRLALLDADPGQAGQVVPGGHKACSRRG